MRLVGEHKGLEHKLIEKVKFGLHESFKVDHRIVKAAVGQKLEITYKGWG